jgi:WD40 repeat protein
MQKRQAVDGEFESDLNSELKRGRYEEGALVVSNTDVAIADNKEKRTSNLEAPTMVLNGHDSAIYSISFDPSGKHLASSSFDKQIRK